MSSTDLIHNVSSPHVNAEHFLQRAHTFDVSLTLPSELATTGFSGVLDVDELLSIFRSEDLEIKTELGQQALDTCAKFQRGTISQEEFLDVMKECCTWTKSAATMLAHSAHAVPVAGALFGLWKALIKTSNAIKDRSRVAQERLNSAEVRQRYLRGLTAGQNLSVETTKIAAVVQEMISRGFDDLETIQLNASSTATIQLLKEEYLPYMRRLHASKATTLHLTELRAKRNELKLRLIRQYEIVDVHRTRIEQGLWEMRNFGALYFLKTNRLPALAREYLLEVHLRAWYTMLGFLDPENSMLDQDEINVGQAAREKVNRIQELYQLYIDARRNLLQSRHESKKESRGVSKHDHAFFITDYGSEQDVLSPKLSIQDLISRNCPHLQPPEGGSIDYDANGVCEIWNDTMFSREDRCSAIGRKVDDALRQHLTCQLYLHGPVWTANFGFMDKLRPSERLIEPVSPDYDRPPPLPVRRTAPL